RYAELRSGTPARNLDSQCRTQKNHQAQTARGERMPAAEFDQKDIRNWSAGGSIRHPDCAGSCIFWFPMKKMRSRAVTAFFKTVGMSFLSTFVA
ncbi:MAG: hypothetical protein ACRER2_02310, partial [Methylococcales bacterium]